MAHGEFETLTVADGFRLVGIGMLLHACEEPGHRLHEGGIIHDGIPLVALQPGSRVPVVLRQNDRIGIGGFYGVPELPPEGMIEIFGVPEVCRHVEPPAVAVIRRADPLLPDTQDIVLEGLGALIIQLGQSVVAPPAVVIPVVRPLAPEELEVVMVGGILADIGSGLIVPVAFVDFFPVQPLVEGAAVVEDPVQDDLDALAVGQGDEVGEIGIGHLEILLIRNACNVLRRVGIVRIPVRNGLPAVVYNLRIMGVDVVVVLNVVLVIRGRYEKGIEVDDLDSQALQVVELFRNPFQVAPVEVADVKSRRKLIPVLDLVGIGIDVMVLVLGDVIRLVPVGKAVDENLVHDGSLGPLGRGEAGHNFEGVLGPELVRDAVAVEKAPVPAPVRRLDPEDIRQRLLPDPKNRLVPVEDLPLLFQSHGGLVKPGLQKNGQAVAMGRPETQGDLVSGLGLRGAYIFPGAVSEEGVSVD